MLSKRILYFVDDRIFFHCPGGTQSEDCEVWLRWAPNSLLQMLHPLRDYKLLVKTYSMRVLSTQNDAFRAMSGIIRRISEIQRWHIVEGMPTMAFENMMLFRRIRHPLSRRLAFPSYSWLGWKGELEFMEGRHFFEAWINWYVRNPATGEVVLAEGQPMPPRPDAQGTGIRASDNTPLHQNPDVLFPQANVQMSQASFSERQAKLQSPQTFSLLCFSTLAVFFELTNMDFVKGIAGVGYPGKQYREQINPIGSVTLDGFDEHPPARDAEFILLSKTIPSDHDLRELGLKRFLDSKEVYMIMLIEWVGDVAERRGIGFMDAIEVQNSMAPGPVWKEIILG